MPVIRSIKTSTKLQILRAPVFARIPSLVHGFSTRRGGVSTCYGAKSLNLGFTADDSRTAVQKNRLRLVEELLGTRTKPWPLVNLRQIHSDLIHHIEAVPPLILAGDGMITSTPGILLAVLTADCLPVIIADPNKNSVGVFHAGWRGTVKRIVEKGVGEMRRRFGSRPVDLRAAIGPGIRSCCYQVGAEVRNTFDAQFAYSAELFRETKQTDEIHERYPLLFLTARAPGHSELPKQIFLDLAEANRRQLLASGLNAKNILDMKLCTSCSSELFFSHRAEKGKTGRMMAVVGIKP